MIATQANIDNICDAFAEVIDAKSPFTYRHSTGVANAAVAIAGQFGMSAAEITFIRRAGLLHDIGKLSVPNEILEKPAKLTDEEWLVVKKHPYYTLEVLRRIPGFEELSEIAAAHHEKLDGSGYFRHWDATLLSTLRTHPRRGGYLRCARCETALSRRVAARHGLRHHAQGRAACH